MKHNKSRGLYRMTITHRSNCNRLNSVVNAVTRDLVESEMFVLQVERQLHHRNTRV